MRLVSIGLATLAMFGAGAGIGAVSAAPLTFDPAVACGTVVCLNSTAISQDYGDTPFLDISYSWLPAFGNGMAVNEAYWWDDNYGSLSGVIWGGDNSTNVLQVSFLARNGATISLNGFQSAGWPNTSYDSELRIYDLDYNLLRSEIYLAPATGFFQFSCQDCTSTTGLILQIGPDGFNVGIDNLNVSTTGGTAVPEPASWTMMIMGFGLIGAAMRRRARQIA